MFKRVLLYLTVGISVLWLGYIAFDLKNGQIQLEPNRLFGDEDSAMILVMRPEEVRMDEIPELYNSPNLELIQTLAQNRYDQAYISAERSQVLLIRNKTWDSESIKALFLNSPELKIDGKKIHFKDYSGEYFKTKLYLSTQLFNTENGTKRLIFDKKASAAVFSLAAGHDDSRTEYYFKPDGLITYKSDENQNIPGTKVNDGAIFAKYISADISAYHFYERDYYSYLDSVFASGPMFLWLDKGFTRITIDGEDAIIGDFVEGQDPDLVLSDFSQSFDTTSFNIPLTKDFPSKGKSYNLAFLDNLVVIAESQSTCDKIISDYRLGNTLSLKSDLHALLFDKLPKQVSERKYSKDELFSTSLYQNSLMHNYVNLNSRPATTSIATSKPVTRSLGEDIYDFWMDAKKNECILLGRTGKIAFYSNGNLTWSKEIESAPITPVASADIFDNGSNYYFFCTEEKLYLFDNKGNSPTGFPIRLDATPTAESAFYRWKGNAYFLVPTGNQVFQFDAKGREINIFKLPVTIDKKPIVWASQSKLFAGISGNNNFIMYEIERRREYRSFPLKNEHIYLKFPNEVFLYTTSEGKLNKTDQKGITSKLGNQEGNFITPQHDLQRTLLIKNNKQLSLTNENGIPYGTIQLPSDELSSVDVVQSLEGKTILALLDGLENNVYLYESNGKRLSLKPLEGQGKVQLETNDSGLIVTTIVGQFVVSYYLNY